MFIFRSNRLFCLSISDGLEEENGEEDDDFEQTYDIDTDADSDYEANLTGEEDWQKLWNGNKINFVIFFAWKNHPVYLFQTLTLFPG